MDERGESVPEFGSQCLRWNQRSSNRYPEIELIRETKSCTNKFCLEKYLKVSIWRWRKEEELCLSSARIKWNKRLSSKLWKSDSRHSATLTIIID